MHMGGSMLLPSGTRASPLHFQIPGNQVYVRIAGGCMDGVHLRSNTYAEVTVATPEAPFECRM